MQVAAIAGKDMKICQRFAFQAGGVTRTYHFNYLLHGILELV
jgi:hypothetical protein